DPLGLDAWTKPRPHSLGSFWDASSTDAHLRFSPGDAGSPITSAGGVSPLSQASISSAPFSSSVNSSPFNGSAFALSGTAGLSAPDGSNIPGRADNATPYGRGPLAPARTLDITDVTGLRKPTVGDYSQQTDPHAAGRLFLDTDAGGTILGNADVQQVKIVVK